MRCAGYSVPLRLICGVLHSARGVQFTSAQHLWSKVWYGIILYAVLNCGALLRCSAAALGAAKKSFLLRLLLFTQGLRGRFLGFVLVVRQAVADLMLAASDVMDYIGNSRRRRNTIGSH